MKKAYYVFIEGILGTPESSDEWTDRAEAYIETNCIGSHATRLEYETGPVFRRMGQEARVDNLEIILKRLQAKKLILVGHSNGCDIIERLINRNNFFIEELHLIGAASEKDFNKNGFNKFLKLEVLKKIFIYWSKNDAALKKAKWSSTLLSWMGLGYGYLGLVGPRKVSKMIRHRVINYEYKFDHSDYFKKENFDLLMKLITEK